MLVCLSLRRLRKSERWVYGDDRDDVEARSTTFGSTVGAVSTSPSISSVASEDRQPSRNEGTYSLASRTKLGETIALRICLGFGATILSRRASSLCGVTSFSVLGATPPCAVMSWRSSLHSSAEFLPARRCSWM
eukprot:7391584-Prymnesium_polylepis.2